MAYISDIIKKGVEHGLAPVLMPKKKLVFIFKCPECKKLKMVKFTNPNRHRIMPKFRSKKSVCTCGYVHRTKGWKD